MDKFGKIGFGVRIVPHQTSALQRIGPVHRLPDLLLDLGVDPLPIISRYVQPDSLFRNPDLYLPLSELMSLLEDAAATSGRDDLGVRLGWLGCVADFGLVGQLMRNAPTLREAIRDLRANHFRHTRGAAVYVHDDIDEQTLGYMLHEDGGTSRQFSMSAVTYGYRLLFELTRVEPERITFACRAPSGDFAARHFRNSIVEFQSLEYGLIYPLKNLDTPIRGAIPARRQAIRTALERYSSLGPKDLLDEVRRAIVQLLVDKRLTASSVAAHMQLHRRTLSRRLLPHGTTVHELIDEVRHAIAGQLMASTSLTLTEIAEFLGYNELSSFTRWMRRMDGAPPSIMRRS